MCSSYFSTNLFSEEEKDSLLGRIYKKIRSRDSGVHEKLLPEKKSEDKKKMMKSPVQQTSQPQDDKEKKVRDEARIVQEKTERGIAASKHAHCMRIL